MKILDENGDLVAGGAIMAEENTARVMGAPLLALFWVEPVILGYDGGGVDRTLGDGEVLAGSTCSRKGSL